LTEEAQRIMAAGERRHRRNSRAGQCIAGIAKALCYVLLFFTIQTAVMSIYGMAYMAGEMAGDMASLYGSYDPSSPFMMDEDYMYDMSEKLMEAMMDNLSLITLISGVVNILFLTVFFKLRRKNLFEECGIRAVPIPRLLWCALIGSSLNVVLSVTISFLPLPTAWVEGLAEQYASIGEEKNLFLGLLATAVMTGLIEEITFRGLAESRLRRGMPGWAAIVLSALIFGICHGTPIAVGYSALMGVLLSLISRRGKSILPAVTTHIFFNAAAYWFVTEDSLLVIALYFICIGVLLGSLFMYFRREKPEDEDAENIPAESQDPRNPQ